MWYLPDRIMRKNECFNVNAVGIYSPVEKMDFDLIIRMNFCRWHFSNILCEKML